MRREQRTSNLRKLNQTQPNVEVVIDELVLHDISPIDRDAIRDALVQELERSFSAIGSQQVFTHEMQLPALNAGRITLAQHAKPENVGVQVARAVYTSLTTGVKGNQ